MEKIKEGCTFDYSWKIFRDEDNQRFVWRHELGEIFIPYNDVYGFSLYKEILCRKCYTMKDKDEELTFGHILTDINLLDEDGSPMYTCSNCNETIEAPNSLLYRLMLGKGIEGLKVLCQPTQRRVNNAH